MREILIRLMKKRTPANPAPGVPEHRLPFRGVALKSVFMILCLPVTTLFLNLEAQRIESEKDKGLFKNGVEFKKNLTWTDQGYQYRLGMENKTNEAMVVEVEVAFSNTEISETFEDTFTIEPGETKTGQWVTKVRGTKDNALVNLRLNKLDVRSAREVAEGRQLQEEREKRAQAQQAVAEAARKQKVADAWQEEMRRLAAASPRAQNLKTTTLAAPEPVRLNADLLKLLLLDMEGERPKPDLSAYSKSVLNYHWNELISAGLVDGVAFKSEEGVITSLMLKKLTREGRVFLLAAKDQARWKQVSEQAANEGDDLSIAKVKELLVAGTGGNTLER